MKRLFTMTLCAVLLSGCKLISSDDDTAVRQTFLFEIEYVNYAWGYAWVGLYVDDEGRIYTYDLGDATWRPQHDSTFSEAELADKYRHNKTQIGTVDPATLSEKIALIRPASEGPLSDPVDRCRDAGVTTFRTFLYDAPTGRYTPVLLYQQGDLAQKNRAAGARLLTAWLKTLDERFSDSFCEP